MKGHRVLIGANGWQHPQWGGEFYPDDLPGEWQLGFYSNEFRLVLIPAAAWPENLAAIDQMLDDAGSGLAFIIEMPPSRCTTALFAQNCQYLARFGEQLLGVIIPVEVIAPWPAWGQSLLDKYRVCVDAGADVTKVQKVLQGIDKRLGYCWHGQEQGELLQHGSLAIARIQSKDINLRQLRSVLEIVLAAQDGQRYLAVIFEGTPPSITLMRQATTLLDML